jgi:5'-deoxynucleotidase YfbR-like HD superfamily hydrolase
MTDEELVKRLRNAKATQDFRHTLEDEAADRIEALTAEIAELREDAAAAWDKCEERRIAKETTEAKLAKAVAFLDDLWDSGDYFAGELNDLRKELKGDIND